MVKLKEEWNAKQNKEAEKKKKMQVKKRVTTDM
jgi:hypothetical protein